MTWAGFADRASTTMPLSGGNADRATMYRVTARDSDTGANAAAPPDAAARAIPERDVLPTVTMIGGGQLARMTHQASIALG